MIQCKGRNGWFDLRTYNVENGPIPGMIRINLFSRRKGDTAPIVIEGSLTDVKELILAIQEDIERLEGSYDDTGKGQQYADE